MPEISQQQQAQAVQQLQQEIQELQQQKEQIQQLKNELTDSQEAIETIGDAEPGEEVLLPLGGGAYVHAEIPDPDNVLTPLGSDVLAEQSPEDASGKLDERKQKAEDALEEIDEQIEQLEGQLQGLAGQGQGQPGQQGGGQAPGAG